MGGRERANDGQANEGHQNQVERNTIEVEYEVEVDGRIEWLSVTIDYSLSLTASQLQAMLEKIGIVGDASDAEDEKWRRWLINQLTANEWN